MNKIFSYIKKRLYRLFFPSNMLISGKCHQCGQCCQRIYIYENDNIIRTEVEFYALQNRVTFYKNLEPSGINSKGELYLKCSLLKDNKCSAYKKRPAVCRQYPSIEMFKNGGVLIDNCGYTMKARRNFEYFLDDFS